MCGRCYERVERFSLHQNCWSLQLKSASRSGDEVHTTYLHHFQKLKKIQEIIINQKHLFYYFSQTSFASTHIASFRLYGTLTGQNR